MFMAWIFLVLLGIVGIVIWQIVKALYHIKKGAKIICPYCGHEIVQFGDRFNCGKCYKPIIMHADGTPRQG
jgi:ribosomal protein S27AE